MPLVPRLCLAPRELREKLVILLAFVVSAVASLAQTSAVPASDSIDLEVYSLIREEAFRHGKAFEYASALTDQIGPRLTGSSNALLANRWTAEVMRSQGLTDVHLEDWGEFGLGWKQNNAWAHLLAPDEEPIWLQAGAWSRSTGGPVRGEVVYLPLKDMSEVKSLGDKINGRIVLLGGPRDIVPVTEPLTKRYSDEDLAGFTHYDDKADGFPVEFRDIVRKFGPIARMRFEAVKELAKYHPLAILEPSRDGAHFAGTGVIFADNTETLVERPFEAGSRLPIPYAIVLPEQYNRLARLASAGVPMAVEVNIDTTVTDDHAHGFNTLGELLGEDPALKDQVVLVGAHLDSWYAGTGATDNAAGVAVALEVTRLLTSLHLRPRRTIRIGLWTGEEEGELGSTAYVKAHLQHSEAVRKDSDKRPMASQSASAWNRFDTYFNLDNGAGRIRGIYTQGDEVDGKLFEGWVKPLKDLGISVVSNQISGSSDGDPFLEAGLASFQFLQDPSDYASRTHHSNLDTLEHLDAGDLEQAAIAEAIFVWNASEQNDMMHRPQVRLAAPLDVPSVETLRNR